MLTEVGILHSGSALSERTAENGAAPLRLNQQGEPG